MTRLTKTMKPKRPERPAYGTVEHDRQITRRLNALRAAVLGANDGVVSIAALVIGVAGAVASSGITESSQIATAGFAGLAAGALSMAAGEYVSVSSQRDAEDAQLARERKWHKERPEWELKQLVELNMETGMSEKVARQAAKEQTAYDPVAAHARLHLGITDPEYLTSPAQAGIASLLAFAVGGTIPILTILLAGPSLRIPLTFSIAIVCLVGTGAAAARIAHSSKMRSVVRNVIGGSLALAITYGIGHLVGTAI
ncbi:MAG: VIT family protein [Demequinaceae bacterium]|nr:VIT family protein [Demequinaceae bacterium]